MGGSNGFFKKCIQVFKRMVDDRKNGNAAGREEQHLGESVCPCHISIPLVWFPWTFFFEPVSRVTPGRALCNLHRCLAHVSIGNSWMLEHLSAFSTALLGEVQCQTIAAMPGHILQWQLTTYFKWPYHIAIAYTARNLLMGSHRFSFCSMSCSETTLITLTSGFGCVDGHFIAAFEIRISFHALSHVERHLWLLRPELKQLGWLL